MGLCHELHSKNNRRLHLNPEPMATSNIGCWLEADDGRRFGSCLLSTHIQISITPNTKDRPGVKSSSPSLSSPLLSLALQKKTKLFFNNLFCLVTCKTTKQAATNTSYNPKVFKHFLRGLVGTQGTTFKRRNLCLSLWRDVRLVCVIKCWRVKLGNNLTRVLSKSLRRGKLSGIGENASEIIP